MPSFFQRNRVLFLHLSFWCVYLSFFIYQISSKRHGQEPNWNRVWASVMLQITFAASIAYFNYFYTLPRFLIQKKIWKYLLEFLIPFAILMTFRILSEEFLEDGWTKKEGYFYSSRFIIQIIAINLFIVIFVGMLRFAVDWFELEAKKKEIENEKLTAELMFLKAQINPHFLFNTLNNLYYLAFTQSPNTTEVIAKLSQMMRYMIYDSNHAKVPLNKEIEYMQSYISLEKLRLNNEIPLEFIIIGDCDNVMIVPLILITFLENAFKHGVSNNNNESYIKVKISVINKVLLYTVENSKIKTTLSGEKSGIGLQNANRRLALSYSGNYELAVVEKSETYLIELKINLG